MPCFHPLDIVIKKPRLVYSWTTLPNGKVKRSDKPIGVEKQYTVRVPCGKCLACLAMQQSQWSFRIEQEVLNGGHASSLFVTFTYDNEHLPEDLSVNKKEVQKYLHDLRQNLYRRYFDGANSESVPIVKYYFCAEYGSKRGRPHYHAILMFSKSIDWTIIQNSWNKGIVDIREFTSARAGYVAKYSVKQLELDYCGRTRPFHLQSKGLGECFLKGRSLRSLRFNPYYSNASGHLVKLPRYYLDKLGSKRYEYKSLDIAIDGVKVTSTRSVVTHSFDYQYLNAYQESKFLHNEVLERKKLNLSYSEYQRFTLDRSLQLEHNLIQLNLKSSYYEKSRLGL